MNKETIDMDLSMPLHGSFLDPTLKLCDRLSKAIATSPSFTIVTNFFGGTPKASYQVGHSDLRFPEFQVLTDRIESAMRREEPLEATIVLQDFEATPDLIVARQRLRNDDKYNTKILATKIGFAAREISTALLAMSELNQAIGNREGISMEVRLTKGMIAFPAFYSSVGAAIGVYLSNLSDYLAPCHWFPSSSGDYALIKDHCDVLVEDSIVVIGKSPHFAAASRLKLGTDAEALEGLFRRRMEGDPRLFPEFFMDTREFLGPEF